MQLKRHPELVSVKLFQSNTESLEMVYSTTKVISDSLSPPVQSQSFTWYECFFLCQISELHIYAFFARHSVARGSYSSSLGKKSHAQSVSQSVMVPKHFVASLFHERCDICLSIMNENLITAKLTE